MEFFSDKKGTACAHCHSSDATGGRSISQAAAAWPSDPAHAGLTSALARRSREFSASADADGFFAAAAKLATKRVPTVQDERLRSLGYVSPSTSQFVRLKPTELLRWSRDTNIGPREELVLAPRPNSGEFLIAVVTDQAGVFEIEVRGVNADNRGLTLSVCASSMTHAPQHVTVAADKPVATLSLRAGRNTVSVRNASDRPFLLSGIYLSPK